MLDLETRRVRPQLEHVRQATVGPDGALYAVDTGSAVTQVVRRAPVRFRSKLQGKPEALYATMGGTLVARIEGRSPAIEILGSDQPPEIVPTPRRSDGHELLGRPRGRRSRHAVVIYESGGKRRARDRSRCRVMLAQVLFSPSGHRIYVARDAAGLLVLDRFERRASFSRSSCPVPPRGLRADPYGQWLLVRPVAGDSAWVVDVGSGRFTGTVKVEWDDDLPPSCRPERC